ncbi:MAG: hypothetical protein NT075_18470 [Chloroflexi bacterium]|nr:hypothetical protein [Chloroflexota bacterium]
MSALNKLMLREKPRAHAIERPRPIKDPSLLAADRRYLSALEQLNQGAYQQTFLLLRGLQLEYPEAPVLASLLAEVQLKTELEVVWAGKIIGRQPRRLPKRLVSLVAYLLVVIILLSGSLGLYRKLQTVNGQTDQQQNLLVQAQAAMEQDQAELAVQLFRQVLALDPENRNAQKGFAGAMLQLKLASEYAAGVQALQMRDLTRALNSLTTIQQEAPNYRDVERLLGELQSTQEAQQHLDAAETAYQAKQWPAAIQAYEAVRQLDSTYAADVVTAHLADAYLAAGQQIVAQRPDQGADLAQAASYFQKASLLPATAAGASQAQTSLATYQAGARALQQANPAQAIAAFEPLYQAQPSYLGGYLTEQLYTAYLAAGDQASQQVDTPRALDFYTKAAALPVPDNQAALDRVQALSATPTATPEPLVAEPAPVVVAQPPTATPEPTPTPMPAGLADFKGWIAFRTNRDGDPAIYLMQPDGSQQQRAPGDAMAAFDQLYSQQQRSADGTTLLYVANAPDRSDANLFLVHTNLPVTATRDLMLTDFPGAEYDPVWSPNGTSLAFVTNQTGNDEVWTMNIVDGVPSGAPVQLTHNEWEWDKHPTWSPDGGQLAFFSNRTGLRQIWVMNADGANQHNSSNNQYEDWDPVWIR